MAKKKVEVDVQIDVDVEPSLKQLRELKKQLKETAAGSTEFKKLSADIDDLEDKLKGAKVGAEDWVDSLASASGPMGMVGRGINQMKVAFSSFNTALKASVIGLIVTTLAGLVAAFSQNETAIKKLQPLFIGLQKILNGIFRAFEPVLDAFMEMVEIVLPPLIKGIGGFYSVLFGLFSLVKEVGVGVGKTLKGIFTFDWDSITEGVQQMAGSVSTAIGQTQDAYTRFTAGTKETTKIEKEQALERQKNAEDAVKKREELRKKELEKEKTDLDAKIKLETDKENSSQEILKTLLDQRMALELDNEELTESQKEVIRQDYVKKLEEALKTDSERQRKIREADLDAKIQLEVEKENTSREKLKELLDLRMMEELSNVELTESQKEVIRKKYQKQLEDSIKADEEVKKKKRLDDLAIDLQNAQSDFDSQLQIYKNYLQSVLNDETIQGDEKVKIVRETNDKIKQLNTQLFQSQEQLRQQTVQSQLRAADALLSITNKETAVGRAALIARQIILARELFFEAKRTIAFSKGAFARSKVAVAEGTAQTAKVGFPQNIPLLIAYAAQAIGIIKAISDATKLAKETSDTSTLGSLPSNTNPPPTTPITVTGVRRAQGGIIRGPGTSTSDSIPALLSDGEFVVNARSTQLFRPLLSAINATSSMPQFAVGGLVSSGLQKDPDQSERITQAVEQAIGQTPIRTFVTAADISNQQQFDRVIKSRSLI